MLVVIFILNGIMHIIADNSCLESVIIYEKRFYYKEAVCLLLACTTLRKIMNPDTLFPRETILVQVQKHRQHLGVFCQ